MQLVCLLIVGSMMAWVVVVVVVVVSVVWSSAVQRREGGADDTRVCGRHGGDGGADAGRLRLGDARADPLRRRGDVLPLLAWVSAVCCKAACCCARACVRASRAASMLVCVASASCCSLRLACTDKHTHTHMRVYCTCEV